MRHVIIGEYKMANPPDPLFPNGRLNKDGHTIQAMEEMEYCPDLLAKYQKKRKCDLYGSHSGRSGDRTSVKL